MTLPRRPRGSWAGQAQQQQLAVNRDTPSPAFSLGLAAGTGARDPIYDGIGPRTSAGGSSVNLNKSMDNAMPAAVSKLSQGSRYPTTLPPLIPPIKEEVPLRHQASDTALGLPKSSPNILDISEPVGAGDKRSPISRLLTAGSDATLNDQEENLSAYFEPFGSALVPCAPGNRDSIASNESDSLLPSDKRENNESESSGSTPPRLNNGVNGHGPTPPLPSIPEMEPVNDHVSQETRGKKQPPPTLPKPKKPTKVSPPAPPPKPKPKPVSPGSGEQNGNSSGNFQDETLDGSEV